MPLCSIYIISFEMLLLCKKSASRFAEFPV
jgi:hypothetical protein